jgi:long-chain acyl-CoA synthetase
LEIQTIAGLAALGAERFEDQCALDFPGSRTLSYKEIDRLSGCFAGGLATLGIRSGDPVVLYLPNSWQWIVAYHAIARLGAVVVPANILLSGVEVSYMLADAGAAALILPADRAESVDAGKARVIATGADGRLTSFDEVMAGEWLAPQDVSPADLFTIGYTSGTTGKPKGAMLTHGNIFTSVLHTVRIHARTVQDRIYSALPFPHVYGSVVMNSLFLTGARLGAPARFEPGEALRAIEEESITLFEGVPTMYYQMLMHPGIEKADLSSLTRCTVGGQCMPIASIEAVVQRFGCPLLELWGMTEVGGPATSHSPSWPPRHGSIGRPFPGMDVRIVDLCDPGREVSLGVAGELMVRGPLVMKGYWNRPKETAETIDANGWLATGDIARIDEDGYLTIVDRKKDMILTAGYNVYPAELEQVIASHPSVAMVAVAGVPDAEKGELAHAYVVPRPGHTPDSGALLAHCRIRLAAYKVPRAIHFVDDLPKTSTGKIMRRTISKLTAQHSDKTGGASQS